MDTYIQRHGFTSRDRYPDVFARLRELLGPTCSRVLCFGSSTGEECLDLADAFPVAVVIGAETDEVRRAVAKTERPHPRVCYVHPSDVITQEFDLITCHSVLCHYPGSKGEPVNRAWSFGAFEATLRDLGARLRVGGWLSVVNAEYEFPDTVLFRDKYRADSLKRSTFVPMFDRRDFATDRGSLDLPVLFQKIAP